MVTLEKSGRSKNMNKSEIVAMAVAAIAEELGTDVKKVKVISFKEIAETQEESK